MAWRRAADPFPAPLRVFRAEDWPPVPGECLEHYGCDYGGGYTAPCAPRPGEFCGQLCYESLVRDFPGRPEVLAAARAADAFTRFHKARLNWLGEDHPGWLVEYFEGDRHDEIRYAPFREA